MKEEKKQFKFSLNKKVISSMANSQPTNLGQGANQLVDSSTCQVQSCHQCITVPIPTISF
ncbi:hypothetical protein AY601_1453 [Pedobacter cryoconitis]|uniref:Uncharacterized protein n=1 Tax=Pedobacter cryoconitis TaxID=188932 RepID=A0A127VAY2_9SPHI|nr:hypothetical protein [Pedobacter cryoconitis]AMP98370.1 hypothetical protein AY601_1453 [Pedobacter cryoconitis]